MGEYAKRKNDGIEIKIGTCESMYYLRYEDKDKVKNDPHSLDPSKELNLFWRLPFPEEDQINPGEYKEFNKGERLYKVIKSDFPNQQDRMEEFSDPSTTEDPGIIQMTHESGMMVNIHCYHGEKLPEGSKDVTPFWNGRSWHYELAHIKNHEDGKIYPIVYCRHCRHMWRYTWEEILPYLHGELKERLEKYNQ